MKKKFYEEMIKALNQIPNTGLNGKFKDTYSLLSAIDTGEMSSKPKKKKQQQTAKTFEVFSSHGTLTVDIRTGDVIKGDYDGEELKNIIRCDIAEHIKYWNIETIAESVDILDMGTWELIEGEEIYTAAEEDWRNECKNTNNN